jgi:hypothetical protein
VKKTVASILILVLAVLLAGCGTALTRAASQGLTDEVRDLLDKGADMNKKPFACSSPFNSLGDADALLCAAYNGHTETVKLLLDRGADVNSMDSKTNTFSALVWVACRGHTNTAKLLIERGADVDHAMARIETMPARWLQCGASDPVGLLARLAKDRKPARQHASTVAQEVFPVVKSDVDELPAIKMKQNKNAYAIVIGIEQYRQQLPKADFATQDARTVAEYLTKAMGYPEENVVMLLNNRAMKSDFEKYFEKWLGNNVEQGSTVFIYYSGHGAPNTRSGDAYLVPYDGDPAFIDETGFSLKRMYSALGKLSAKEVIVALDSCFSGAGGRSVIAKGSRPLVMNLQQDILLSKNMTVLSASSGDQTSTTYDQKGHGLFTYFMLKGMKDEDIVRQDGSLNVDDLYSYIKPQVESIARKKYNNEQTPQLIGSKKN